MTTATERIVKTTDRLYDALNAEPLSPDEAMTALSNVVGELLVGHFKQETWTDKIKSLGTVVGRYCELYLERERAEAETVKH